MMSVIARRRVVSVQTVASTSDSCAGIDEIGSMRTSGLGETAREAVAPRAATRRAGDADPR